MLKYLAIPLLIASALSLPAKGQEASDTCAPAKEARETLKNQYNETLRFTGITENNLLMEIYVSSDHSSWTIVLGVPAPNGMRCITLSGVDFDERPEAIPHYEYP